MPAFLWFSRQLQHLVRHVEPLGFSGWADATRRQQDVDASSRAKVKNRLSLRELHERGRVAAAERGEHRGIWQRVLLGAVIEFLM